MPFKNEHAARQAPAEGFDRIRRVKPDGWPDGLEAVFGFKGESSTILSIRANSKLWSPEKFKAWLDEHDAKANVEEAKADEADLDGVTWDDVGSQDAAEERSRRWDRGVLGKVKVNRSTGFVRVPATLTRCGVLLYTRADGSTRRELRHPEHVYDERSLDSLRGAPVTDQHPRVPVTRENAKQLSIGFTGDDCGDDRRDDYLVRGSLTVTDGKFVKGTLTRPEKCEVSCGYDQVFVARPGVWNGPNGPERFDGIQTEILYNHVAIVPKGRAGPDVRLHLDAADAAEADQRDQHKGARTMASISIGGVTFSDVDPALAAAIVADQKTRDDTTDTERKRADAAEAKADQADKDLEETKAKALDETQVAEKVAERVAFIERVRTLDGVDTETVAKLATLTIDEARRVVLSKLDSKLDLEGKSDAYIEARFDAAIESAEKREDRTDSTARKLAGVKSSAPDRSKVQDEINTKLNTLDAAWEGRPAN